MSSSFRERYCALHGIELKEFEVRLLPRGLYLHARPFRALLALITDYFAADREFLRAAGDLRSRRFFHGEAGEYHSDPANLRFLRRYLRLRVSAERVRRIMEETWAQTGGSSAATTSV